MKLADVVVRDKNLYKNTKNLKLLVCVVMYFSNS